MKHALLPLLILFWGGLVAVKAQSQFAFLTDLHINPGTDTETYYFVITCDLIIYLSVNELITRVFAQHNAKQLSVYFQNNAFIYSSVKYNETTLPAHVKEYVYTTGYSEKKMVLKPYLWSLSKTKQKICITPIHSIMAEYIPLW